MSKSQSLQRILAQAKEKEKKCDWAKAAELYEQALRVVEKKDFLKKGETQEKIGFCFHRAALQAGKQDAFNEHIRKAIKAYKTASSAFTSLSSPADQASGIRCKALALYCSQYLLKEHHEIRTGLYTILELQKRAFEVFKNCGDAAGKVDQCRDVLQTINDLLEYEETKDKRIELVDLGLAYSEEAIQTFLDLKNERDLADVYLKASELCGTGSGIFADENQRVTCEKKQEEYLGSALELSERNGDWITRAKAVSSHVHWRRLRSAGEAAPVYLRNMHDLLGDCRKTRNREITTSIINSIIYGLLHQLLSATDRDKADEIFATIKKYGDESVRLNSVTGGILRAIASLGDTYWNLGISYRYYGLLFENDPEARVKLLDKGIRIAKKMRSRTSPVSRMVCFLSTYSYHLNARASLERNAADRKKLLLEALDISNQWVKGIENLFPYFYRLIADHLLVYSSINAKLAQMEASDTRIKMLHEASEYSKKGIKYLATGILDKSLRIKLAESLFELGRIQFELFHATANHGFLRESFLTLGKAAQNYSAEGLYVRTAETFWSLAKIQDTTEQFQEAAKNFELASENYEVVAAKIPQLKDFYLDYASYMDAWSEVERAKHHHAEKRYGQAKKHYKKAANLHKSTERWSYLVPNYLAWTQLEEAENISRREQTEEAIDLFQQAAELFVEAKKSIGAKLEKIEVRDEKETAGELAKASDTRREYCLGRIALEEAKILDRQGDHTTSSKRYGSAAEIFQKIAEGESEQSRKELQPIIYLCQAWQKMMMAEAKASSTIYGKAAELFKQAKEHTIDQPTSLLALANSSFCKALAAGTEFEITRDMKMYSTAKKHMEAAENYYLKAGFKTASEYAKATYMLFDAYMYTHKAETETDPRRKAQYYQMAEKLLQASASSYTKAKHPEKSEEVQRLLESAIEKRQLAMSLTEVLHAPRIASTTTSFTTPTPTHEKAVGLERFEHAHIQANLTTSQEVVVGEELEVRLDLVNVAKDSGLLVRIDDLVPPIFKVTAPPSQYSIEDGSIDLKGKRLEPLKVESVKLSLQATKAGVIDLRPQIIYVDEVGDFRKCMPEPAAITVYPRLTFKFKTAAAQKVFDYLSKSFVEDYMRRRLVVQEAGWRSFVQIIRNAKVSSRSVYGSRGHHGSAILELERRGLIETRIFLGERGRGGKIVKTRISYEKETVKRLVDQKVVKNE